MTFKGPIYIFYLTTAYDVILLIRIRRTAFSQYRDFFNKNSLEATNVNWIIQSWLKEEIEAKKICGINNGTLQFFSLRTPKFIIGHYHFPTSFQDITYIANRTIGLKLNVSYAKVVDVRQYNGRCYGNPYARAMMDISSDFRNPSVYLKQSSSYFAGYAYFYCSSPPEKKYSWKVALLNPDNTTVGNYLIVSNQTSWTMSARSFAYGFYYVTYRVGNPANPRQVGFDYGFLKIIPGPLYVYISKGSKAVYVEKSNIIMDGLETYDPDVFAQKGHYSDMNFTWVCYKSGENPDVYNASFLPVVYPDGSAPTSLPDDVDPDLLTGGCFDTGPGRLLFDNSTVTITFNNSLMVQGNTYYMALIVQKRHRVDIYTQKITIAKAPPKFNISCFSNCLPVNALINVRLGLRTHCLGPRCGRLLTYKWFMYYKEEDDTEGDWKEKDGFYEHLLTSFTSTEIILKANFLQLKKRYQIKFRVLTEHGGEGYTYYNFRTNTPPQGGSCEMDKSTGQAVLDEFELQCYDWIDHDLPLMYQVNIPKLDGTYIVFAVAPNNSITLRLPVGDKNYGYHLRLEVFIMDSLKASSKVNVSIFVYPPEPTDLDARLPSLIGENSELDNLVNGENNQVAVQLSIGVLSAVDNLRENNATTTNNSLLRENIIKSVTKLRMNDTESVNQIASVLVEATKEEMDITPTSGVSTHLQQGAQSSNHF
ncbi:hypothetical protein OS493_013400 [Desmophyllum pertusum]|uniref:PKD/REJ-like domain-containing protein n=1 Tax=Desmophyllum pertusum TaxID=174260 RepID=A0A9W9YGR3_9CNID|nr:hypothetical protein OS493_013400 [Desmophyllum pertusum]